MACFWQVQHLLILFFSVLPFSAVLQVRSYFCRFFQVLTSFFFFIFLFGSRSSCRSTFTIDIEQGLVFTRTKILRWLKLCWYDCDCIVGFFWVMLFFFLWIWYCTVCYMLASGLICFRIYMFRYLQAVAGLFITFPCPPITCLTHLTRWWGTGLHQVWEVQPIPIPQTNPHYLPVVFKTRDNP